MGQVFLKNILCNYIKLKEKRQHITAQYNNKIYLKLTTQRTLSL